MGLSQSKELIRTLTAACVEADRDGKCHVDSVLSNQDFMKNLATIWEALPAESRTKISGSRSRNAARKAAAQSVSEITVPELINSDFQQWKENFMTFFTHNEKKQMDLSSYPLASTYNFLHEAQSHGLVCKIQQRIFYVVFYRLKVRFGRDRLHSDVLTKFTRIILRSGLVAGDERAIENRLSDWASLGARYDLLASDLEGLGSLILLPDIGDSLWEKELRMKGEAREQVIKSLKDRNLHGNANTSGANDVANNILNYLWKPIEESISKDAEEMDLAGPSGGSVSLLQTSHSAAHSHQQAGRDLTPGRDRRPTESDQVQPVLPDNERAALVPLTAIEVHRSNMEFRERNHSSTRKRRRSGTSNSRDEQQSSVRENSVFSDATQSTSSDAETRLGEELSTPARSTERLDDTRYLSSLAVGSSLHGPTVDPPSAGMQEQAVVVDSRQPSADGISSRNPNEPDSRVAEILSELRSRTDNINTDRGSYFSQPSGNVPQMPTSSSSNTQPGISHSASSMEFSHGFSVATNRDSNQPRLQVPGSASTNGVSYNPANVDMGYHNVSTPNSSENDISTLSNVHRPCSFPAGDAQTARSTTFVQKNSRAYAQPNKDTAAVSGEQTYMQTGDTPTTFEINMHGYLQNNDYVPGLNATPQQTAVPEINMHGYLRNSEHTPISDFPGLNAAPQQTAFPEINMHEYLQNNDYTFTSDVPRFSPASQQTTIPGINIHEHLQHNGIFNQVLGQTRDTVS